MDHVRRKVLAFVALAIAVGFVPPVAAQDVWPSKPIKLVVPYAVAGTTDLIARRLGERLGKELGRPIVVENRGGAGTNLGASLVAEAKPDGYTLLLGSIFQVLNPIFGPKPNFDLFDSLEPVSLVADMPFLLAAHPKQPYRNGRDLVSAARLAPKKFSVANAQLDVSLELLNQKAGMQLLLIPYRGGGAAATDAIAGQVDMVYALIPVLQPHINAGTLRPLAVTATTRFAGMPDVPTFTESGVSFDMTMWYGVFTPKGTPAPIVERLSSAIHKIMADQEMVDWLRATGAEPTVNTPAEFQDFLRKEDDYWNSVAKDIPSLVKKQ